MKTHYKRHFKFNKRNLFYRKPDVYKVEESLYEPFEGEIAAQQVRELLNEYKLRDSSLLSDSFGETSNSEKQFVTLFDFTDEKYFHEESYF